ncbi:hypothetical protein [Ramlibacter sp.]|uniref:hypothetical protein n=1 Tax=Ramlibacter sp. TaxID=1917967 RepID=UPI002FCA4E0B
MPSRIASLRHLLLVACVAGSTVGAHAGRPLAVDDANVNEPGRGQLETWVAGSEGARLFNVAPAYAPIRGLELGALLAQDSVARQTLTAVQAKWQATPSASSGCNAGLVAGASRASGDGSAAYLNGLLTCNSEPLGSFHFNLGASKPRHEPAAPTWGVAYEREIGHVTPHIEWFGARHTRPTLQAGLRGLVAPLVQLDGSVGRGGDQTLFTIGLKYQF